MDMKMDPKAIRTEFNRLAKKGGEAVIRVEAVWHASGLEDRFGPWQDGMMAVCVFSGAAQENTRVIGISGVTEEDGKLTAHVYKGMLGGPPSRPGHLSYPQDVKWVPQSEKPVEFEYNGAVKPNRIKKPTAGK
jgi:hypothetical protein